MLNESATYEGTLEDFGIVPQLHSVSLDLDYVSDSLGLDKFVSEVAEEIEVHTRTRRRRGNSKIRFLADLKLLILNLYCAYQRLPELTVGVDLNANVYAGGGRYADRGIRYRSMRSSLNGLVGLGLAEIVKRGVYAPNDGRRYNTKIRATADLITKLERVHKFNPGEIDRVYRSEDDIKLRDRSKKPIQFAECDHTERMRCRLRTLNELLRSAVIGIDLTIEKRDEMQREMTGGKKGYAFDPTKRTLTRVFTDGSFERGGRFYQPSWQQMPKKYRPYLIVNGERTVEVDYSCLHPTMLAAKQKVDLGTDAYNVFPDTPEPPRVRRWVKKTFAALINDETGKIHQPLTSPRGRNHPSS
jgi:hypothetical protein